MELISAPIDMLGINYYTSYVVRAGFSHRFHGTPYVGSGNVDSVGAGRPQSARGWEVDPDGLYDLLTRVSRSCDAPPLWIIENGMALNDVVTPDGNVHDLERIAYLDAHFRAAHRAIGAGVDLRGYFIWTLIDNFEWSFGESSRFGLIHVDYDTQVRTPRDSAGWFARVVADNGLIGASV